MDKPIDKKIISYVYNKQLRELIHNTLIEMPYEEVFGVIDASSKIPINGSITEAELNIIIEYLGKKPFKFVSVFFKSIYNFIEVEKPITEDGKNLKDVVEDAILKDKLLEDEAPTDESDNNIDDLDNYL